MKIPMPSTLDRYVVANWLRIFVLTSLGFPIVSIVINLTDSLNKLLDRGLTTREIAFSYIYSVPENMFLVMPAAVLFATVFTIGAMGRYSELTAAKASGLSFHRVVLPIVVLSVVASGLTFVVGELAPGATARQQELQKARQVRPTRSRFNFVYRGDAGLGLHHPVARRANPPAQAAPFRAGRDWTHRIPTSSSRRTAPATATPCARGASGTARAG